MSFATAYLHFRETFSKLQNHITWPYSPPMKYLEHSTCHMLNSKWRLILLNFMATRKVSTLFFYLLYFLWYCKNWLTLKGSAWKYKPNTQILIIWAIMALAWMLVKHFFFNLVTAMLKSEPCFFQTCYLFKSKMQLKLDICYLSWVKTYC